MAWHWLDYVILGVVGLSVVTGLFRGFVKEVIALCVWVLAIWLSFTYSSTINPWFESYIQDTTARVVVSFVSILIVTLIVGGLFNAILSMILRRTGLSGTDRLLGTGFGFLRGVFIVSLMMLVVKMTSIPYEQYRSQSQLYAKFDPFVNWLSGFMPNVIEKVKVFDTAEIKEEFEIERT